MSGEVGEDAAKSPFDKNCQKGRITVDVVTLPMKEDEGSARVSGRVKNEPVKGATCE